MKSQSRTLFKAVGLLLALALVFAACTSDDDDDVSAGGDDGTASDSDGGDGGDGQGEDLEGIEAVYAEIEGLTGDERRQRLIELAEEEGGEVVTYTSDIEAVLETLEPDFEADTGIDMQVTRLGSEEILTRLLQESNAGQVGADTVLITQADAWAAASEDLFAPFNSPLADVLRPEAVVQEHFMGATLAPLIPVWNTDQVDDPPETWQEVFTDYPSFGLETTDYFLYAELIKHFMETNDWTEQEAVDFLKEAASERGRVIKGHSSLQNLLNSGEFAIAAGQYNSVADAAINEGAPAAWKPTTTPVIAITAPVAVPADAPHPAAGLLLAEYRLQEGQRIAFEATNLAGTNPDFVPSVEEVLGVPAEDVILSSREVEFADREKWEALYQEIIQAAGGG